jgi:Delta3-Delta2-enoyl-CoA isomerase
MEHIRWERDGELAVVTMARGKANALNAAMMDELLEAVAQAAADESVRGVVLASDRPRFFSAGFDVREVFGYDRPQMAEFFGRFTRLYESLRALPKPVVGALSGHTFAGGSILALACDLRVMARGPYGFAVNEINLGLVLSPEISRMLTEAVGVGRARELLLSGDPVTPERAYEIGLVHELADEGAVRDRAVARARSLAAKPPMALGIMKAGLRGRRSEPADVGRFVDLWFSEEATDARRRVVEKLAAG